MAVLERKHTHQHMMLKLFQFQNLLIKTLLQKKQAIHFLAFSQTLWQMAERKCSMRTEHQ